MDIYNLVVELIGTVPSELTWIYGIGTVILVAVMISCVVFPFVLIYKIWS